MVIADGGMALMPNASLMKLMTTTFFPGYLQAAQPVTPKLTPLIGIKIRRFATTSTVFRKVMVQLDTMPHPWREVARRIMIDSLPTMTRNSRKCYLYLTDSQPPHIVPLIMKDFRLHISPPTHSLHIVLSYYPRVYGSNRNA